MRVLYDNKLVSSLLLFFDNQIQKNGNGFINNSGLFYPVMSDIQGYTAFAAPFKPLCNDVSISGATVMSGISINGNPISIGQSGLYSINHDRGMVYFTGNVGTPVISGNYAIKEFGVYLADQPEYKLLFETKYITNTKHNQVLTGLPLDTKTCPAIFVRVADSENKPFAFGGTDDNSIRLRIVIVTDNEFQRISVCNIFKNMNLKNVPIYNSLPFDRNGAFTGINYNYNNLSLDTTNTPTIMKSKIITVNSKEGTPNDNKTTSIVEMDISTMMGHF